MPIVVFACKSNSCRSQMAEGWAHKWLEDQIDILDSELKDFLDENEEKGDSSDSSADRWSRGVKEHVDMLKDTVVVSVALDSSSVFEDMMSVIQSSSLHCLPRKQVKSKAVDAMKDYGVDISLYQPKTIDEIMPIIKVVDDTLPAEIAPESTSGHNSLLDFTPNKPVDKLIVLCSCGQEMKYKLARRSKSVEEWSIDAPTAASKAGEGDEAYRRVSLEIKNEVNILMRSLLGSPC
jgi:protein-tyrosine-phosphatase